MDTDRSAMSEAARAMGRARTAAKKASGEVNAEKARAARWADPAARQRQAKAIRDAAARRKAAAGDMASVDVQSEAGETNGNR